MLRRMETRACVAQLFGTIYGDTKLNFRFVTSFMSKKIGFMLATKSYLLCKEERLDVVFTVEVLLLDQLPASPSVLNPSEEENEAVSVTVLNKFLGLEVVDFFNLMKNDDNMLMLDHYKPCLA
jgi:hypothetical protein